MLAKKLGFGFGVAIILPILIYYGVSTFTVNPDYRDYYRNTSYSQFDDTSKEERKKVQLRREKANELYQIAKAEFGKKLFYVAVPLGLIAIIVGAFLSMQAIGAGLVFGGIFTVIEGYCGYWSDLPDTMRFISLLLAFVLLIVVGYLKVNDKNKEK